MKLTFYIRPWWISIITVIEPVWIALRSFVMPEEITFSGWKRVNQWQKLMRFLIGMQICTRVTTQIFLHPKSIGSFVFLYLAWQGRYCMFIQYLPLRLNKNVSTRDTFETRTVSDKYHLSINVHSWTIWYKLKGSIQGIQHVHRFIFRSCEPEQALFTEEDLELWLKPMTTSK